jgi:hypothetical protein
MCVKHPKPRPRGTFRQLLSGGGLELDDELGGHPSAVLHLDALRLGPLADLGAVVAVCRRLAAAPGWPPGTAPGPPRRPHVARQCIPQCLGVPGVQVDLVLGTVQPASRSSMNSVCIFWATGLSFPH